jgi:REP element-mobilizing transposase RayT
LVVEGDQQRRQLLRLRGFDYASAGIYYVTICVHDRNCLFGAVIEGRFVESEAGQTIESWWGNIERRFPGVMLGSYVVMPNHIHGIVMLGCDPGANQPMTVQPTLSEVIGWFKSMSTNDYIRGVRELEWPPFRGKLWQRGFHDHIVRNEASLKRIEEYIKNNPANWDRDEMNSENL